MQGPTEENAPCGKAMSSFHALKSHCKKFHKNNEPIFSKKNGKLHAMGPYEEMVESSIAMVICRWDTFSRDYACRSSRMPQCMKTMPAREFNKHWGGAGKGQRGIHDNIDNMNAWKIKVGTLLRI